MGFVLLFVAIIAAIVIWWLSRQRLFAKPWLEEGLAGEFPGTGASQLPAAKLGLGVFLAVVGSLFALSLSAYVMRMENADWRPLPAPTVLWFNTGLLILSSVARCNGRTSARAEATWRACRPASWQRALSPSPSSPVSSSRGDNWTPPAIT